jgi:hypothetical protein
MDDGKVYEGEVVGGSWKEALSLPVAQINRYATNAGVDWKDSLVEIPAKEGGEA